MDDDGSVPPDFLASGRLESAMRGLGVDLIGKSIGVYHITARLGVGGMGEVYRARDMKLGRDVAIKVLPHGLTSDPDRLVRFDREARLLATLNHPHIASIHSFEDATGVPALVLELVEGETLAERLARGPLPVAEALPFARQIAEALEAAHEKGIIHRDLKPANIKITPAGDVKVLDFGLAKLIERPDSGLQASGLSSEGMILGTAAYMSPEQAQGRAVDKRTDIWALGCVLYEMLSGRPPFTGDTVSETLADVMKSEPPWTALPASLPANLSTVIRRCLVKDPRQRIRDVGDVRLALEGVFETAGVQAVAAAAAPRVVWMGAFAVAAVLAALLAIPAWRHLRETPPPAPPALPETRVDIVTPASDSSIATSCGGCPSFALSPDGRQIVFVASGDGASRLWLRSLATTTALPLASTEGAWAPFWSPDSRSIGFFVGGALKRLDLGGGAPQTLAPVNFGQGGTWNAEGVIVFASNTTALRRVSATGGAAAAVTTLGPQQAGHVAPWFLPDGRRFLFSVVGAPDTSGIYLGALDGSAPTRLTPAAGVGVYLPSGPGRAGAFREGGWLLWGVRAGQLAGQLVAQRLDVRQVTLTSEPVTVADGVVAVSAAATGLVAYRTGLGYPRQLTWVDRSGTARGTVGDRDGTLVDPRVSPNGRRVAVTRTVQGDRDLWLLDGARTTRLTFDPAVDETPLWSPDGTRIVFRSFRTGGYDLYEKLSSGAGEEKRLVTSNERKTPISWSADGRFLLYQSADQANNLDLWVVPMLDDRTPSVFLKTQFREGYGAFSPDGRWVAYQSNESGRPEIYLRPFVPRGAAGTAASGQWQVSTAGGIHPVWRPDGKELYYLDPAGAMMAAPVTVSGATLEPGAPVVLFPTRIMGGGVDTQQRRQYDVAPDGRFLINMVLDSAAAPITLLQNWNPDAKK